MQESRSIKDSGKRRFYNKMPAGIMADEYNMIIADRMLGYEKHLWSGIRSKGVGAGTAP